MANERMNSVLCFSRIMSNLWVCPGSQPNGAQDTTFPVRSLRGDINIPYRLPVWDCGSHSEWTWRSRKKTTWCPIFVLPIYVRFINLWKLFFISWNDFIFAFLVLRLPIWKSIDYSAFLKLNFDICSTKLIVSRFKFIHLKVK